MTARLRAARARGRAQERGRRAGPRGRLLAAPGARRRRPLPPERAGPAAASRRAAARRPAAPAAAWPAGSDTRSSRRGRARQRAPQLLPRGRLVEAAALDDRAAARPRAPPRSRCATSTGSSAFEVRAPCPRASSCRSRPRPRRISHSMAGGAASSRSRYASAPCAFKKVSGSSPVGQLDDVDAQALLEQHVEALARRLLARLVLVEVHDDLLGEAAEQAGVGRGQRGAAGGHDLARRPPRGPAPRRGSPPSVRRAPSLRIASLAQESP